MIACLLNLIKFFSSNINEDEDQKQTKEQNKQTKQKSNPKYTLTEMKWNETNYSLISLEMNIDFSFVSRVMLLPARTDNVREQTQ